jgi:hypothetical protein
MQIRSANLSGVIRPRRRPTRVGLDAGSAGARAPGAHKFTRANDFKRLTALSRNFAVDPTVFSRQRGAGDALSSVSGRPERLSHFASCAEAAQDKQKRNESFARRNEMFRNAGRKSLASLCAPNQHFAALFVFKGLTPFSFRAFSKGLFPTQKSPPQRSARCS